MGKNSIAIILMGIGAAAIYLGASGNLESALKGIRGQCCGCNADTAAQPVNPSGTLLMNNVQIPQAAGHAMRSGYYYGGTTGELYITDNGTY
jgi:hypothetical protein